MNAAPDNVVPVAIVTWSPALTSELTVLVLAALLHMAQMVLPGYFMTRTPEGRAYNASPRDADRKPGLQEGRATAAVVRRDRL